MHTMEIIARGTSVSPVTRFATGRVAIWNRRLLMLAVVVILWAATILALEMAGPEAQEMLAGEGMLINPAK
jgi:hypothetical protein